MDRVEAKEHDFAGSGIDGNGGRYACCTCGWCSQKCPTAAAASAELLEHWKAEGAPGL